MPGFLLVPYILIPFAPLTRKRVAASTSKRAVRSGEYAYCVRISDDGPHVLAHTRTARAVRYAYGQVSVRTLLTVWHERVPFPYD